MENMKLYCLIYELKGIVSSLSDMGDEDEHYHNPLTEKIETKTDQIIEIIEQN